MNVLRRTRKWMLSAQRVAGGCLAARASLLAPGRGSERGSSLVEFALVLPMMMVLITGMYSLGIALSNYVVLTNAVGAGARAFAISPAVTINLGSGKTGPVADPCAYGIQLANQASPTIPSGAVTYTFTYTVASTGKSTKYTTGTCSGITTAVGDTVQLGASYPYNFLLYGFKPGTLTLQARSAELVQ